MADSDFPFIAIEVVNGVIPNYDEVVAELPMDYDNKVWWERAAEHIFHRNLSKWDWRQLEQLLRLYDNQGKVLDPSIIEVRIQYIVAWLLSQHDYDIKIAVVSWLLSLAYDDVLILG